MQTPGNKEQVKLKSSASVSPPFSPEPEPFKLSATSPVEELSLDGETSEKRLQEMVELQRRRVAQRNAAQCRQEAAEERRTQRAQTPGRVRERGRRVKPPRPFRHVWSLRRTAHPKAVTLVSNSLSLLTSSPGSKHGWFHLTTCVSDRDSVFSVANLRD